MVAASCCVWPQLIEMGDLPVISATNSRFAEISNWLRPLVCLLAVCAGCTSIESTMVTRDESNQTWERHNCLNGIPITLKVPTHLKLYVFHKHYLEFDSRKNEVSPVAVDVVVRDFAHEFMYTDKIFVVDFKRPPAGSSNLDVNMTEEQYIDHIQHDITDSTISSVTGLLGAFTGNKGLSGVTASGEDKPKFKEIRSLVAVGIFEIEAPDFEQKVREFLDCHINKAHDAWVVPPCVDGINRVGIPPCDNTVTPYPQIPLCPANGECPCEPKGGPPVSARYTKPGKQTAMK
jgi:hypothetical protein